MSQNNIYGDRYKCLHHIGEGGMASVYLAIDLKLNRKVAIKIMHHHMRKKEDLRERFRREAYSVSKLKHPNVLEIYDFSGDKSEDLWIVTEFISGVDLNKFSKQDENQPINPFVATCIVREITKALAAAHKLDIIHRDIKPSNIMISKSGSIKLMDFGIAKDLQHTDFTNVGAFMGSPSYMSPEQIRGQAIDVRSDLYALSILYYELLVSELPFKGSNPHEVIMKAMNRDATPAGEVDHQIPRFMSEFIQKGLTKEIGKRHQSAIDILNILDSYLRKHGLDESGVELEKLFSNPISYKKRLEELGLTRALYNDRPTDEIAQTILSEVEDSKKIHDELMSKLKKMSQRPKPSDLDRDNPAKKKQTHNIAHRIVKKESVQSIGSGQQRKRKVFKTKERIFKKAEIRRQKTRNKGNYTKQTKRTPSLSFLFLMSIVFIIVAIVIDRTKFNESINFSKIRNIFPWTQKLEMEKKSSVSDIEVNTNPVTKNEKKNDNKIHPSKEKTINRQHHHDKSTEIKKNPPKSSPQTKVKSIMNKVKPNTTKDKKRKRGNNLQIKLAKKPSLKPTVKKEKRSIKVAKKMKEVKKINNTFTKRKAPRSVVLANVSPNSDVYINNDLKGKSNELSKGILKLPRGTHTINFRKNGYYRFIKKIRVDGKTPYNLGVINLKKLKLHPLQIDSPTGTQVAINNGKGRLIEKYQSNGKIKKINLESGQYSVEARNGDKSFIRTIKLPNLYGKVTIIIDFDE